MHENACEGEIYRIMIKISFQAKLAQFFLNSTNTIYYMRVFGIHYTVYNIHTKQ